MHTDQIPPKRILRMKEAVARTALSRSTIQRLSDAGHFPKPLRLSVHRIGFLEADVLAWIDAKAPRSEAEDAEVSAAAKRIRRRGAASKAATART